MGWGWDGNKRGMEAWQQASSAWGGKPASTQHPTAEREEHRKTENAGEQACLHITQGTLPSARGGKWFGVLAGIFWI